MTASDPKAIRGEDWAGEMGERWLANLDLFEEMIAGIGDALIDAAEPRRGETVLDVGCGGGATTIALARAVGPEGTATGLDISHALTDAALRRAARGGVRNIAMITADATTVSLQKHAYDLLFSRFGVMFFDDPVAAFRNLRPSLKAGGRVRFACWAAPVENQWIMTVLGVLSKHIELPPPVPRAPGPFAFAEPDYVRQILSDAGYAHVALVPWRGRVLLGGKGATARSAAEFVIGALSVGEIVRAQPAEIQRVVLNDVEAAFAPFAAGEGVDFAAAVWFVSATP